MEILVTKADGSRQTFSREKIIKTCLTQTKLSPVATGETEGPEAKGSIRKILSSVGMSGARALKS